MLFTEARARLAQKHKLTVQNTTFCSFFILCVQKATRLRPLHEFSHTITVLDFTAQIGLYALAQLSGSWHPDHRHPAALLAPTGTGPCGGRPLVDWHRPAQVGDLGQLQPDVAATAVLMGPGSIHLLEPHWAPMCCTHPRPSGFSCCRTPCWRAMPSMRRCAPARTPTCRFFNSPTAIPRRCGSS